MNMTDTRISRKEKYQHVKVFVRVRPISDAEVRNKSKNIIEINNSKEVTVRECLNDRLSKKFKFDNVFGPSSRQVDIYNTVVGSLMEQILSGYNCTILAYGQTGTGKTFTMEGINTGSNLYWQSDSSAGIIPRSLSHLFDKLQLSEVQEYTVRVSFLEIYNEELFDLLSVNDDGLKIKLYEDTSRKGAIIIQGLEEVIIHNISEVYKVLQRGLQRRQIATTLINAQSSRSHTVFSITVHMKETTVGGDDVLKTGKLNLVDLAGSENVGRSGAADRRVKEAGSINQSLLTLSRVITALVEKAPHIPYRESKLTRLLQESLGGRAKTSIIATISPASINIGETLSTLDYAHRARNITNRPEINQKLSKKEFRKQYLEEIERLQRDLLATRHKIGVYLADENYKEIQELISQQVKEIEEKNNHIKALETIMQNKEKIFNDIKMKSIAREKELYEIKIKLNSVESALLSTNNKLQQTVQELNKQKYLVEQYKNTEQSLLSQATALLSIADTAIEDSYKLHDKIAHKTEIERILENLGEEFKSNVSEYLQSVENDVSTCGERLKQFCTSIKNELVIATSVGCKNIDTALQQISSSLSAQYLSDTNNNLTNYINETVNYQSWIQNEMRNTVDAMECDQEYVNAISQTLSQHINDIIDNQFAKILQTIRNDVSQNLKQTSTLIDKIIDSACSYQFETYNHVTKNIEVIMKDVETVCEKQVLSEKQRLLTKIMADAFSQYNDLSKSLEDHHCTVINKCDSLNKICNTINDQTVNNCNVSVKINDLQEELQRSIKQTENDVIVRTNQNKEVANKITEEGKHIMSTLQSNINKSHNAFEQYKNTVERNIKEFQPQVDTDNNKALSLITNLARKVMLGANKDQEEFIADIKIKISDTLQEISAVLDNQVVESCAWSNNAIKQLRTAEAEINKFFNEDLQYDIPTGSTPVRKEFSYPRQFAVTSPHDRLLQRFRKSRKLIEAAAEDNMSIADEGTPTPIANSTMVSDDTSDILSSYVENDTIIQPHVQPKISTSTRIENKNNNSNPPRARKYKSIRRSSVYH